MVIRLKVDGDKLQVRPAGFLAGQAFQTYLLTCRKFGVFNTEQKCFDIPSALKNDLEAELKTLGFTLEDKMIAVRRSAKDDEEKQAAKGIIRIAGLDPDWAREKNGVGFSGFDAEFGHRIAEVAKSGQGTEKQWEAIKKLAHKYRKQIGGDQPSLL